MELSDLPCQLSSLECDLLILFVSSVVVEFVSSKPETAKKLKLAAKNVG